MGYNKHGSLVVRNSVFAPAINPVLQRSFYLILFTVITVVHYDLNPVHIKNLYLISDIEYKKNTELYNHWIVRAPSRYKMYRENGM